MASHNWKRLDLENLQIKRGTWTQPVTGKNTNNHNNAEAYYDLTEDGKILARILQRYVPIYQSAYLTAKLVNLPLWIKIIAPSCWTNQSHVCNYLRIGDSTAKMVDNYRFDAKFINVLPVNNYCWHLANQPEHKYVDVCINDTTGENICVFRVLESCLPNFNRILGKAQEINGYLRLLAGSNHFFDKNTKVTDWLTAIEKPENKNGKAVYKYLVPNEIIITKTRINKNGRITVPSLGLDTVKVSRKVAHVIEQKLKLAEIEKAKIRINLSRMMQAQVEKKCLHHVDLDDLFSMKTELQEKYDSNSDDCTKEQNRLECLVCMDAERETVFRPCHHIISCYECSQKLAECPVCQAQIKGKDRIYI